MAENIREEWEIDRDRAEITSLLGRYRNITHRKIAYILNSRRQAEYKQALAELNATEENSALPALPAKPYKLTRQMVDYDVRAIREDLRNYTRETYEQLIADQLGRALELHETAYKGYERSQEDVDEIERKETSVELKTTLGELLKHIGVDMSRMFTPKQLNQRVTIPGARKIASKRKKAQSIGDAKHLMVADRAQARIDKLLRLEKPVVVDIKTREALAALLGVAVDQLPGEAALAAESTTADEPAETETNLEESAPEELTAEPAAESAAEPPDDAAVD
jgi:hypothetical protein